MDEAEVIGWRDRMCDVDEVLAILKRIWKMV